MDIPNKGYKLKQGRSDFTLHSYRIQLWVDYPYRRFHDQILEKSLNHSSSTMFPEHSSLPGTAEQSLFLLLTV